jgi:hypothetical protein
VTANIKLEWYPAPDLPPDVVNNCADCECFVVATRRVEVGDEFLWNYPFAGHLTLIRAVPAPTIRVVQVRALHPPKPMAAPAKQKLMPFIAKPNAAPSRKNLIPKLDPECVSPGTSKCQLGKCWFYGGRLLPSRKRR